MAITEPGGLKALVDVERGIVSREIFVNEEIYRQELERIFARAWLFIGHASQIPRPGDFVTSSMGEESVILCRDRAGRVRVFLNSCRHRGMKVCRYDEGNTVEFMCPYHGWTYGTDGALVGVPFGKDAYGAQLDRSQWGLIEVARMENYKGTIWARAAKPDAESGGGTARRRRSSNTSGGTSSTSTCSSTRGTGARAAPRSSAETTSGSSPVTGSSPPRISRAIAITA